jgi:hypothetical protein
MVIWHGTGTAPARHGAALTGNRDYSRRNSIGWAFRMLMIVPATTILTFGQSTKPGAVHWAIVR